MKFAHLLTLLLFSTGTALADGRAVTFYSDGALVEIEATSAKGSTEIPLPRGVIDDSLRIKPLGGAVIQRVDIQPSRREGKNENELDGLLERKNRLEDRLQALSTREDIFTAAAKSQSGKAPRKTKTNPDPLQSIRQGTDFAIAQLEAVYTARRKTTQEIRILEARIVVLRSAGAGSETVARVSVTPKNGRIRIYYALAGQGWSPRYDLRLKGNGTAAILLYGQPPGAFGSYLQRAAPGKLADSATARPVPVAPGMLARLGEYILASEEERFGSGISGSFSALLTNKNSGYLPAGEISLFRNDEYIGRLRFDGISSGRSRRVSTIR